MGKTFCCQLCDYTSATLTQLKSHTTYKHDETKYNCNFCQQEFKAKWILRQHIERKHSKAPVKEIKSKSSKVPVKKETSENRKKVPKVPVANNDSQISPLVHIVEKAKDINNLSSMNRINDETEDPLNLVMNENKDNRTAQVENTNPKRRKLKSSQLGSIVESKPKSRISFTKLASTIDSKLKDRSQSKNNHEIADKKPDVSDFQSFRKGRIKEELTEHAEIDGQVEDMFSHF